MSTAATSVPNDATTTMPYAASPLDPALLARLARRVVAGTRAEVRTVFSPMTGAPIADLPLSGESDVTAAIEHARAAQRAWAATPLTRRTAVMQRLHDLILARQVELLDIMQLECGKARLHAFEEVADIALVARHYSRMAAAYLAPKATMGAYPVLTRAHTYHDPIGVVGVVTPWNYPLTLPIGDSIPALVAGNSVVLRPDPQTSWTALFGADLLAEAGLPDGVLQVVTGDGPTIGQAVVEQADYVCYTGSTEVGRGIAQTAARRLVGSSMELGGKNTMYVRADADLDRTVRGAIRSAFGSAGQLCIHAERLVLHEEIADAFLDRFIPAVTAMRIGTALEYGYDMGSLASQRQLDRVSAHVADALAHGAQLLAGGRARPELGPFVFEPTVLTGVSAAMACRDQETFGPVLAVYRVDGDDQAVALANDTAYGLNGSVWGRDVRAAVAVARRIRAGTVGINDGYAASWSATGAPMGGMGQSGLGRRHGSEGIRKFTETQTVAIQRGLDIGPTMGLDDKRFAAALTVGLRVLNRLGLT